MRQFAWTACLFLTLGDTLAAQGGPVEHWIITRIPSADRQAAGSEPRSFHMDVSWKADSLLAAIQEAGSLTGTVTAGRVEARWPDTDTRVLLLSGRRVGTDSMFGTWVTSAPPERRGEWVAGRVRSRAPRSFTYRPERWYTTYSSANAPELRVVPGDTISSRGETSGSGIVPAPIHVEGALPGDLLSVRILRIRATSLSAWSQRNLVLEWFTTEFARGARPPAGPTWPWILDTIAGVAQPDTTCARCKGPALLRLSGLTIPYRPMVGNIGVAPESREAHLAPQEGNYGGNLDYKWLREGTTLYLPVYHPGALLSIARDMHAAQGDGELAGTGIEMEADVDIVVDVIRSTNVTGIRAEDDAYRMAFGVSADLAQALRIANTNLAEWLAADFRLNQQELAMLLGSAVELDIANVWGAQTTVVAKIRKDLLARIK